MARRQARGGRRPDYQWTGLAVFVASTLSSTAANFMGSSGLGGNISGTIARVRGDLSVYLDVGAADESAVAAMGLIVGNDDQVVTGSAAFPSPVIDLEADWLYHTFLSLKSITGTQSDVLGGQVARREIDSKAMRRIKPNDNLVCVGAVTIQSGAPTVDFMGAIRVLIQS